MNNILQKDNEHLESQRNKLEKKLNVHMEELNLDMRREASITRIASERLRTLRRQADEAETLRKRCTELELTLEERKKDLNNAGERLHKAHKREEENKKELQKLKYPKEVSSPLQREVIGNLQHQVFELDRQKNDQAREIESLMQEIAELQQNRGKDVRTIAPAKTLDIPTDQRGLSSTLSYLNAYNVMEDSSEPFDFQDSPRARHNSTLLLKPLSAKPEELRLRQFFYINVVQIKAKMKAEGNVEGLEAELNSASELFRRSQKQKVPTTEYREWIKDKLESAFQDALE